MWSCSTGFSLYLSLHTIIYIGSLSVFQCFCLHRLKSVLQGAQEPVEFIGGVEIGFQFAGAEAFAEIVEAASEKIERGGEDFAVGENNIAPGGIRAAGQAQGVTESRASESDREAVFVESVVEKRGEGDGGELREMRCEADGIVMLLRAEPQWAGADLLKDSDKGRDTGVVRVFGIPDQGIRGFLEKVSVRVRESG